MSYYGPCGAYRTAREASLRQALEYAYSDGLPWMLGGDFNAAPVVTQADLARIGIRAVLAALRNGGTCWGSRKIINK